MSILSKFKKSSDIPEELPDLAIDELKKDLKSASNQEKEKISSKNDSVQEDNSNEKTSSDEDKPAQKQPETEEVVEEVVEEVEENQENSQEKDNKEIVKEVAQGIDNDEDSKDSYFSKILNSIKDESKGINKIKELGNSKSNLEEMKKHWEKRSDKIILNALHKKFKEKINSKISRLKELEYSWRETYTELIEKEGEITKEERELKEIIREFMSFYKTEQNEEKKDKSKKKKKHIIE